MLTDLICARLEDAQAVLTTPSSARPWRSLQLKRVDQIKLASLALLICGEPLVPGAVSRSARAFTMLASAGDEGPWVARVPDDLVSRLAAEDPDALPALAEKWSQTQEARLDRWKSPDVLAALREFGDLCRAAVRDQLQVLLWFAL